MTAWKPPIKIEPYPTESLGGFLIRFCEVNAWPTLTHFASLLGITVRDVRFQSGDLAELEARLGLPKGALPWEGSRHGSRQISFGGQKLNTGHFHKGRRVCRSCLAESGYARSYWDLSFISHCHIHKQALERHCGCGKDLTWQDPSLAHCRDCLNEGVPPASGGARSPSQPFQQWSLVRLGASHADTPMSLLDAIPFAIALKFVRYVGQLEIGGYAFNRPSNLPHTDFELREVGFAIVRDGNLPSLFTRVVKDFRTATGIVCPERACDALGWFGNTLMYEFDVTGVEALKDYLVTSLSEALGYTVTDLNRAGYISVARLAALYRVTRAVILRALEEVGTASSALEIEGQVVIPENVISDVATAIRAS